MPHPISLPIDAHLKEISESLSRHPNLVISAEPGAGKSTRVPWFLASKSNQKVLVLQPRRVAAQMLSSFVAREQGHSLGQEVGYHIRYDKRFTAQSKLIYITEGLLKKYIQQDPFLENIGLVILDEFHERSLNSDIAIMMLKKLQTEVRPDLKIVVMSATMDSSKVSSYLENAPILNIKGRSFPVETFYHSEKIEDIQDSRSLLAPLRNALNWSLSKTNGGNILIFLPGAREINYCLKELSLSHKDYNFYPLYSSLSQQQIQAALNPQNQNKIIFSTNIAETSLTIENLEIVIDSGLTKESSLSLPYLIPLLRTQRISQASSDQRKGRAGRTNSGKCFRLWTEHDQNFLNKYDIPEIMRSDLSEELPYLKDLGFEGSPQDYPWFEAPPEKLLIASTQKAQSLGLMNSSPKTHALLNSPLSLRLARFLEEVIKLQGYLCSKSILWCTALEELSIPQRTGNFEEIVTSLQNELIHSKTYKRIIDFYKKQIKLEHPSNTDSLIKALISVYKDRVCKIRSSQNRNQVEILLNGGRGARFISNININNDLEYFLALDIRDSEVQNKHSLISMYFSFNKDFLIKNFGELVHIKKWVEKTSDSIKFYEAKFFEDLPLEESRPSSADKKTILEYFSQQALNDWDNFIELDETLSQLWKRLQIFSKEIAFSIVTPTQEELNLLDINIKNLNDLATCSDLQKLILSSLDYSQKQNLEKICPESLHLPKGRKALIKYEISPKISASASLRLQDAFEWKTHPTICNRKIPIKLELLSPASRPIQITEDIISFWTGSYKEIRKEMKARYPKHMWPEHPHQVNK